MQTISARIHHTSAATVLPVFSEFARLLDLELQSDGGSLSLALSGGRIGLTSAGGGLDLRIEAETDRRLFLLQQMVMTRLDRLDPVPRLDWEHVDAGALPPNLSIATVGGIRQVSPNFRRVRLHFADVARYADNGLHFRLVIPAAPPETARGGSVAEWPVIDDSGRTRWPAGDRALHRPVYTVREIDAAAGWMDFDVYLHDGGRVSAWTRRAQPGDRIGLMGPTLLNPAKPGWVGYFGDETALPAIAMHLSRLPDDTRGRAVIALANQADRQALTHPRGVTLDWISRSEGALLDALKATVLPDSDRYVFFAGERAEADLARAWLRDDRGLAKAETQVTAYWSQDGAE